MKFRVREGSHTTAIPVDGQVQLQPVTYSKSDIFDEDNAIAIDLLLRDTGKFECLDERPDTVARSKYELSGLSAWEVHKRQQATGPEGREPLPGETSYRGRQGPPYYGVPPEGPLSNRNMNTDDTNRLAAADVQRRSSYREATTPAGTPLNPVHQPLLSDDTVRLTPVNAGQPII